MTDVLQKGRTLTRFGFSVYDIARLITVEISHITHRPLDRPILNECNG